MASLPKSPHWKYEFEQKGCPRWVSKVSGNGLVLCSFAECFPYNDAEQAMQEMVDFANAWIEHQRLLRHSGHDVEEFYG